MLDRLPEFIDPLLLAEKNRNFRGVLPLKSMGRLADVIKNPEEIVDIDLAFGKNGKIAVISGRIKTKLLLECQNCLENYDWPIDSTFKLGIVTSLDEVELLPEDYEPILMDKNQIALKDIIEEEILLSIPAIPKHKEQCFDTEKVRHNKELNEETIIESPFSILKNLKTPE